MNDEERLNSTVEELGKLVSEAPIVETGDDVTEVDSDNYSRSIQKVKYYDYFTSMDRHIRILGQTLQNISTIAVKLPVIKPQSACTDMLGHLRHYRHGRQTRGGTLQHARFRQGDRLLQRTE